MLEFGARGSSVAGVCAYREARVFGTDWVETKFAEHRGLQRCAEGRQNNSYGSQASTSSSNRRSKPLSGDGTDAGTR